MIRDGIDGRPKVKQEKAYFSNNFSRPKGPKCHHCGKVGHIKKNCRYLLKNNASRPNFKEKTNHVEHEVENFRPRPSSENESAGSSVLLAIRALSAHGTHRPNLLNTWIVDSGATCHMCNDNNNNFYNNFWVFI